MQKFSGLRDSFDELCGMLRKFSLVERVLTQSESRSVKRIYILKPFSKVGKKAARDLVVSNSRGFTPDVQRCSWLELVERLSASYSVGDVDVIMSAYGKFLDDERDNSDDERNDNVV
jgi:hypothetical protein